MNVGVVGLGKMGILHSGILHTIKDVRMTAVTEKEGLLMNYIKGALPKINVYQGLQKMLDGEDLELVYITTPPLSHVPIALECIKRGINFFIEKPLTSNLEDAKTLCENLQGVDLVHSVGYNLRFLETFAKTKYLLDQKILGDISSVKSSMYVSNIFSKPSGWRFKKKGSGGGVLLDLGCHLVDLLLWYVGSVKTVSGNTKSLYSAVDDTAHMEMEFPGGVKGTLDTSWSIEGYRMPEINIEVTGSNGSLRVNQDFIKIDLVKPVPSIQETKSVIYKQAIEQGVSFDVGGPDYTREDIHMVECIKEKRRPLVDVFEASRTQSVISAMYDSAQSQANEEVRYLV